MACYLCQERPCARLISSVVEPVIARRAHFGTARLAREFPHQVAVRAAQVSARHAELLAFCEALSLAPRQYTVRRADVDYVVFCFADAQHAARFREHFDGEPFDPRQRGRGARWHEWRQGWCVAAVGLTVHWRVARPIVGCENGREPVREWVPFSCLKS
jgi:hypothetical protein